MKTDFSILSTSYDQSIYPPHNERWFKTNTTKQHDHIFGKRIWLSNIKSHIYSYSKEKWYENFLLTAKVSLLIDSTTNLPRSNNLIFFFMNHKFDLFINVILSTIQPWNLCFRKPETAIVTYCLHLSVIAITYYPIYINLYQQKKVEG